MIKKILVAGAGLGAAYFAVGNILYEKVLVRPDEREKKVIKHSVDPETAAKYKADPGSIPDEKEWFFTFAAEDTAIVSLRGETIHANIALQGEPTHKWVVYSHGYSNNPAGHAALGWGMYKMGFNVLFPNLKGHARSESRAASMGWLDRLDVIDWISYILTIDPEAEIVLYGMSMGGATTMMTTGESLPENVRCAIADCGYTSVWDEFSVQIKEMLHLPVFPFLNAGRTVIKMRGKYDIKEASSLEQVRKSNIPTLFIHGDKDAFVPFWMLDVLYDNAACEKEKLVIEGGEHGNSHVVNPELYWGTIKAFVEKHIL